MVKSIRISIVTYSRIDWNKYFSGYDNTEEDLLWGREWIAYDRQPREKQVVFGHTPLRTFLPYAAGTGDICIDCGCVYGGSLCALVIQEDGSRTLVSVRKSERTVRRSLRIEKKNRKSCYAEKFLYFRPAPGPRHVIRFDGRPFGDVAEMEQALISNWNSRVGRDDTVYILVTSSGERSRSGGVWCRCLRAIRS